MNNSFDFSMRKFILILVLIFSIQPWTKAEVIVVVKNKLDDNIFIKRKQDTSEKAIKAAMDGCIILFKYNESMSLSKRKEMANACYIYKVLDYDNL